MLHNVNIRSAKVQPNNHCKELSNRTYVSNGLERPTWLRLCWTGTTKETTPYKPISKHFPSTPSAETPTAMAKVARILFRSVKLIINLNPCFVFSRNLCVLTSDDNNVGIAKDFLSIFTRHPFSPDDPELKTLAPFLNTKVVETVLNGFKSWRKAHTFFIWASSQHGYKHNIYTYNAMASILSSARQNAALKGLSLDVVNSRCKMSPGALGFLIRCFGDVGLADEANELFDKVKLTGLCVPNQYSYNCLLEAICRSSSLELIEMRLKEMRDRGWEFDKYTLTPLLQFYCNVGEFDKALDVFNQIYDRGWLDAHVFSILVLSFSKWGKVDKAFELIERMEVRNVHLNEKTFYLLIHGFVKASRVDKALDLYDKMKKCGFAPEISLYDVLIGGLCANKESEKALQLYSEMMELQIKPDIGIISKLVSCFSEEQVLFCLLRDIHKDMDLESLTLLYNSVLDSLVRNGLINRACELLRAMMGDQVGGDVETSELFKGRELVHTDTTSFSIVIGGLLNASKLDSARSLFKDMTQTGYKPDLLLYNNVIEALCNSDRFEESYELLREMESTVFGPTHYTYNCIYGCLCRRKDVLGALDLVKKMHPLGHQPWIKNSTLLVQELCKDGKAVEACNFLAEMLQVGFLPHMVPYSACLYGLIKVQEVDKAMKLFQGICGGGHCPDLVAYNIMIRGLCKAERIAEAESLLNDMAMKGIVPSVVTYNLLIDGLCKTGRINEAMLYLSKIFDRGIEPNVITFTTLLDGLCNAGRPDDAILLWNEMEGKGCIPNHICFMAFIYGLCKCGRSNAALFHFREMEGKEMKPDSYIYVALINAFLASSNHPMAFEILEEMVEKGYFPGSHDKNHVILKDAILKLLEDVRTSSRVKNLIEKSSISTLKLSNVGSGYLVEPIIQVEGFNNSKESVT